MTEQPANARLSRQNASDLLTAALEQTAEALQAEHEELIERFPAMVHQPLPPSMDPQTLRDFTQSDTYRQTVEAHIAGRMEVNLLVRITELLTELMPPVFASS